MADDPRLPAPAPVPALGRAAAERVLARAAELQLARAGGDDGALSEADLVAAAREAGIAPEHVRRALAEERLRAGRALPAADGGVAGRVAGPALVAAEREVAGPASRVLDAIGAHLERDEGMRLLRRTGGAGPADEAHAVWEPRRDVLGQLARGLRGGAPALRGVPVVRAVALPLAPPAGDRVVVRVEADLAGPRRQRLAAGAAFAGLGVVSGGSVLTLGVVAHALLAVLAPLAAVPVVAGGAAAWALARGHRGAVERARAALERVLDAAERPALGAAGAAPRAAALLEALDGVRRALR